MTAVPVHTLDFMVSYTANDSSWAEWIAWQLTADGYRVSLQAWDMPPGTNFIGAMHRTITEAERLVVVMSPHYFASAYAQAEWQPFFQRNPASSDSLILPIRVAPVEPPGLLAPIQYVDLFDLSHMEARTVLLSAARAKRGAPIKEPEFPGRSLNNASANSAVPPFPGRAKQALRFPKEYELHANELSGLRTLSAELADYLITHGYSVEDSAYFTISLHELVTNATKHVPDATRVKVVVHEAPRDPYNYHDSLYVQVIDEGTGFDFGGTLSRLEQQLERKDIEHGLLRATRLVSLVSQESLSPHTMSLWKERAPNPAPFAFEDSRVFPIVFDYGSEAIRIGSNIHTFFQFQAYLKRSRALWR